MDRKSFCASEKQNSTLYNDELLKLVDCFNASDLIIGQIKFYKDVDDKLDYYIVGQMEADWLIVDKITGEIRVVELYSGVALWCCAANGSSFLEAILTANMFFYKSALDDDILDSQIVTCTMAEECSELAGGKKYLEFYKILMGCFE